MNFAKLVEVMKEVCVPRPAESDEPFEMQSVYVFARKDGQYEWLTSVWGDGEFHVESRGEDVLFWSPGVFYVTVRDMVLDKVTGDISAITQARIALQYLFFELMYPDPRDMQLSPTKQSAYYFPQEIGDGSELSRYTPVFGEIDGDYGWWHNDGQVEDISHYLPDCRLETGLLDEIFGDPR
jgi:hypothetical protein